MSLTAPKLDDRDWNSLVEEAKQRIAVKCPNWTDFNPSDPGMMLVDLLAWMTETVLYRLNRVPDVNYIKFLELVGMRLRPARPARTWVFFQLAEGLSEESLKPVPKGTRVSTRPQAGREPIPFITQSDLQLTACKIIKTCSRYRTGGTDPVNEREEIHHLTDVAAWETEIFQLPASESSRGTPPAHHLYLGDPRLREVDGQTVLAVLVDIENAQNGHLFLEWEAWDGKYWQVVIPVEDTTDGFRHNGRVLFKELPKLGPLSKAQLTSRLAESGAAIRSDPGAPAWLRARLVGSTFENLQSIGLTSLRCELGLEEHQFPVLPRRAFLASPRLEIAPAAHRQAVPPVSLPLQPIEMNQDFYPFGTRPMAGSAFYIESPLFEKSGALIQMRFELRNSLPLQEGVPLEIHWEYPTFDRSWEPLGICRPGGVAASDWQLNDGTEAFTKSGRGIVQFRCPTNMVAIQIGGQPGWFIRARIETANFQQAPDAVVVAESIALRFSNEIRPWAFYLSENYSEFSEPVDGNPFAPFRIDSLKDPCFYVCFNNRPASPGPHHLFLDVVPQALEPQNAAEWTDEDALGTAGNETSFSRWLWRPEERIVNQNGMQLKWEYWALDRWKPLLIHRDGTEGFTHEGVLEFFSPRDWERTKEFRESGYWLRIRWELGKFVRVPRLRRMLLNGIEVEQRAPDDRVLGSSDGSANQEFSLGASILEGPVIEVRESDRSTEEEVKRLRENTKMPVTSEPTGSWVKWAEVRNFFYSGPDDRHFTVDLNSGTFCFGDNIHGQIPPAGKENIRTKYAVSQGDQGNVGPGAIAVLESSVPGVQSVTNVHPAEGGCALESIEAVKERGPWEIKHRDRAVTEEDFVHLARKASALVGPAQCYQEGGEICVVIVPRESGERPQPNRWLIDEVTRYLEARRLINTQFKVFGPVYETIDVQLDLVLDPMFIGKFNEIKLQAEERLRTFVHPVTGFNGAGWPLGRTLHLSELYYRLEDIEALDHVGGLKMARGGTGQWGADSISIGTRSYPCFGSVEIRQSFDQ